VSSRASLLPTAHLPPARLPRDDPDPEHRAVPPGRLPPLGLRPRVLPAPTLVAESLGVRPPAAYPPRFLASHPPTTTPSTMREAVSLHMGQSGVQTGNACSWE
jgi:hypothetical protein